MSDQPSIAIIGGGPSGSTLATLLARANWNVGIFQPEVNRDLLVGESLVPAVIPILRELDVEKEVKSYSQYKPGACFNVKNEVSLEYDFSRIPSSLPPYAYNVPRAKFNRTLLSNAQNEGATRFPLKVKLEVDDDSRRVRLSTETLQNIEGSFPNEPDLIVDATGRARLLPDLLDLPSRRVGDTQKTALFTHFDTMNETEKGHVHTEIFDEGWAWRIPLPNRVSFGIVTRPSVLDRIGEETEEQLNYFLEQVPRLRAVSEPSNRIEPILRYDNYQLVTEELYGENWVLLGDTAGFIDPVFSTGLCLAMKSATKMAEVLIKEGQNGLASYQKNVLDRLKTWQEIVRYFYEGRLIALFQTGEEVKDTFLGGLINTHMEKHAGRIFTGAAAQSWYSQLLLRFMTTYGLRDQNPEDYRVFSSP